MCQIILSQIKCYDFLWVYDSWGELHQTCITNLTLGQIYLANINFLRLDPLCKQGSCLLTKQQIL